MLRWCYENCVVVLSPSLAEGFGLPAVEALDLGAPLVTSLDPALVEVSGDAAEHLPADDVAGWAEAALRHLERPAATRATGAGAGGPGTTWPRRQSRRSPAAPRRSAPAEHPVDDIGHRAAETRP